MALRSATTLRDENAALRARIAELERRLADEQALAAECEQLRFALAEANAGLDTVQAALVEREQELYALHDTALVLMHHLDVGQVLRTIVTRAAALGGTPHGFLYLVNQAERALEISVGVGAHESNTGYRLRRGEGLSGRVWETGQPLVVRDYPRWPGRRARRPDAPFHAIVAVPLLASERGVVGVLGLSFADDARTPGDDTVDLLTRFAQLATLALDNARLYTAARRQARDLELLGQVRAALAREVDLQSLFRTVVEAIVTSFGYTQVSIYLLDGEHLVLQHQIGYHTALTRIAVSDGVSGRVVRTGAPVLIRDVRAEPEFLGAIDGIASEVCVPLFDGERVIGILNVESVSGVQLTEDDLALMQALAEHVSMAIRRAQLYDAAQRRVRELEALRETLASISASLDLDALLTAILERQVELLAAGSGELSLYDPARRDLLVVKSYNMDRDYAGTRIALGEGIMGHVALTHRPLNLLDYSQWPNRMGAYDSHQVMAALVVPMLAGSELVGVLGVGDSKPGRVFTDDDTRLLSLFAQQATVAIKNARLFEEARQLSITDPLMGLYNRRHFFELARREHERARRYGRQLAALMIDVDDFKRINDTFGHATGDRVLQAVGDLCRQTLRSVDVVGRYGGEEIVALLPDADVERARMAGERLRAAMPSIGDLLPGSHLITASIGVAVYDPGDPVSVETLIDRADRAQYRAKNSGKDRVVVWSSATPPPEDSSPSTLKVR